MTKIKKRNGRYDFNLNKERIEKEYRLGKNAKSIHDDLQKEGKFNYSYTVFLRYLKENFRKPATPNYANIPPKIDMESRDSVDKELLRKKEARRDRELEYKRNQIV